MEVGEKLKELNMTADEMGRLSQAFKDETFVGMLRDYAEEISDPENKRRYEQEIAALEEERGINIEFIHPEPFRALRTSVDGQRKCYVNICSNQKVGKPECKGGVSEDGRRGQCWSLPHSLHPARPDRDSKGNAVAIYDVIFHPDTLHIASKNQRFMDMVDGTAVQGIQDAFKVTLDKGNMRRLKTKYKGTPQPCVIRKPIPGFQAPAEDPGPLAFPYPDVEKPSKPAEAPPQPQTFQARPPSRTAEPTKPRYAVKYRSVVDMQDFRCSRDSARGPRPREIVVTVDLPLLEHVSDTDLEVKGNRLLRLDSHRPAYRLELPLAYPVDQDQGSAKFNKHKRQLVVTLPVLPPEETFDYSWGPCRSDGGPQGGGGEGEERKEEGGEEEESGLDGEEGPKMQGKETGVEGGKGEGGEGSGVVEEQEKEGGREAENGEGGDEGVGEERKEGEDDKEEREDEEKGLEQVGGEEDGDVAGEEEAGSVGVGGEEEQRDVGEERGDEEGVMMEEVGGENRREEEGTTRDKEDGEGGDGGDECEERRWKEQSGEDGEGGDEEKDGKNLKEQEGGSEKGGKSTVGLSEEEVGASAAPEIHEGPRDEKSEHLGGKVQMEAAFLSQGSHEESSVTASRGFHETEDVDEDDLQTEQSVQTTEQQDNSQAPPPPPPVLLREVDEDGNENVISDHSTSAGFIFQNHLMYELD